MREQLIYIAEDGSRWDTDEECMTYEHQTTIREDLTQFLRKESPYFVDDCKELATLITTFYDLTKKA